MKSPLVSAAAKPTEPTRDLNNELCSARFEAEPSASLRVTALPLDRKPERPSASDKDLKREVCSAKLEADPIEALR